MSDDDTYKKIQKLTLYTLNTFITFCEKHKLRYYFTGGALIGVLRHKGFVPWDDDIDIGMPRKDYDRFLKLIDKYMPKGFNICTRFTDQNWHFAMSQFIDEESEVVIHLAETPRDAHIWIDIFPLDGLPDNLIARWFRVKNIMFHRYLVQIANISTQVDTNRKRPMLEKLLIAIFRFIPIGKLINTNKVLEKKKKILRKSDFDKAVWYGNMLGRYREKEVVKREWFGLPQKGEFEGQQVNIPEKSDYILKSLYGDYMVLPPEKDRISHNVTIVRSREI